MTAAGHPRSRPAAKRLSTFSFFARSPQSPMRRISLEVLNADVLLLIFQYLRWPEDLYALALVSKTLNQQTTPELYRTIVIVPSPRATLALLGRLERDDALCAVVQTLVFDSVVRAVHPQIPRADDFDSARNKDLADGAVPREYGAEYASAGGDPQRVRLRLHHVLPKLQSLQEVYVKRWNHTLLGPLSASECYHYWSPYGYAEQQAAGAIGNVRQGLLKKFRFSTPYLGPPAVMHGDRQPCPLDIVSLLMLRCPKIEKLSVIGIFPSLRFSHPTYAFQKLTTLVIGEQTAGVATWNGVLRHCKELRMLGLLNVHFRFEKLMEGCYFPHLESIGMCHCMLLQTSFHELCLVEWYQYAFTASVSNRKPAKSFAEFIQKHSETLKCIALGPRQYHPLRGLPYDGGLPFFDPDNNVNESFP